MGAATWRAFHFVATGWKTVFLFLAGTRTVLRHHVQTDFAAQLDPCPLGTGGLLRWESETFRSPLQTQPISSVHRNFLDFTVFTILKRVNCFSILTEQQAMKTYWGSGSIAPHILDLGIGWR